MTNQHSTKRMLIASILVLAMCFTALIGTTFAWFTDSVTSGGNKIVSGTLIVDLELLGEDNTTWSSIKENKTPLYTYENWEPGYVDVKVLKVENEGSLALKWKAKFVSNAELGILADVIDVYVLPYGVRDDATTVTYPENRDLTGYTKVGTLREFVNTIESTTYGELEKNESAYLGIALKMQETAGNDYQDETLGAFDIQIVATQLASEDDSFGNDYDKDAVYFENISNPVERPTNTTISTTLSSEGENKVVVELPAEVVNNLPAEVTKISIGHSTPKIDTVANTVTFDTLEVIDQDGNAIDLTANTTPIAVCLEVPFADGTVLDIYHDNVLICAATVENGTITYESLHFCTVKLVESKPIDIYTEADFNKAVAGQVVNLCSDVALSTTLTLPENITLNGNGYTINGTIYADRELTIAGHVKVHTFKMTSNTTVNIPVGACLEVTGNTRTTTLGYGYVFNIVGSIVDAKTADKSTVQPSLILPQGLSITGGGNHAVMNVTNAYVSIGNTSSKNSAANSVFTLNFNNSIAEFTHQFTLAEPTSGCTPTFNINVVDSVFTTVSKICIAAPDSNVVFDNSIVKSATYFRNSGNVTVKNGTTFSAGTIQFGENGGNNGTITVDNSTFTITAGSVGHAFDGKGVGQIIIQNNSDASVDYYKDMEIVCDETSTFTTKVTG